MKQVSDIRTCSVGRSLMILGDRWTFLILREAFFGIRYYDGFLANLGIATNILSQRLKILVENGILERGKDKKDARRVRYGLTRKGLELYSITLAILEWGDRWLAGAEGPPLLLYHETCGHRLKSVMCCAHCGEPVDARDVRYEEGPGMAAFKGPEKRKKRSRGG